MAMTQAQAQTNLDAAEAALTAATTAQSYSIGDLSVQRASLAELRQQVAYWRRVVNQYAARDAGVNNPGAAFASFR